MGKPLAGATHAALHLVDHHQPAALVAQHAQLLQVVHAHGVQPAFSLDGFEEHRHHVGVAFGGGLDGIDVVDRNADKAFDQRAKAAVDLGVAGGRHGGNRAAMEGFFINHDLGPGDTFVDAVLARDLQRCLVGFQARVAEEHVGHARQLHQAGRELLLARDVVIVRGMDELGNLVLQRGH